MSSFVVLTPSRGLVHSRTVAAVVSNVREAIAAGHEWRGWEMTHNLPLPACHERVVERPTARRCARWCARWANSPAGSREAAGGSESARKVRLHRGAAPPHTVAALRATLVRP
jgi:hypothetical protein